jgi:hypothetical protein
MLKVKAQMSNKAQNSNVQQISGIRSFVINLTFACLPPAGILKFGILEGVGISKNIWLWRVES